MGKDFQDIEVDSYARYLANVDPFIRDVILSEKVDDFNYVDGSRRIEFYANHIDSTRDIIIDDLLSKAQASARPHVFESALLAQILQPRPFNLLLLIGGLGAGKTTTVDFILRRFSESCQPTQGSCPYACKVCFRKPLYFDFRSLSQQRPIDPPTTANSVFKHIRISVYKRLISEWLEANDVKPSEVEQIDENFIVLRRLLIVNDLMLWEGPDHPESVGLDYPPLRLPTPLLAIKPTFSVLRKLIVSNYEKAREFDQLLRECLSDFGLSRNFMSFLLQFYVYRCHPTNPKSLLVIDNLDQLPTEHIEYFVRQLHDIASRTSGLPILVPLRPSSLNPVGFPRSIRYTYHYGPNNFEMILRRIENAVLSRSTEALRGGRNDGLPAAFLSPPSKSEYRTFLFASYFYARIMAAALQSRKINIHKDNRFVEHVDLPSDSLADLAETADALVGTCCRYAFDLAERYYRNMYTQPVLFSRAEKRLRSGAGSVTLLLDFPLVINAMLAEPARGNREPNRVANLFRPPVIPRRREWPSLAKIRALAALSVEKRLEVGQIVQQLARYGVPLEVAVSALNSLHDKFRLLIWFSTNQELDWKSESSFSEDVVISEHGLGYFQRVAGDFEYLWHCSSEIMSVDRKNLTFERKLMLYHELSRKIGIVEWLQRSFKRLENTEPSDIGRTGEAGRMIVLTLLYSSLSRAVRSSGILLRQHGRNASLFNKINPLLEALLSEILFWQHKYRLLYLTNSYVDEYEREIKRLSEELLSLRRDGLISDKLNELVQEAQESWYDEKLCTYVDLDELALATVPREDVVTLTARYGRGVIPGIEGWVRSLDGHERVKARIGAYLESRRRLKDLLASRVPTYTDLQRHLTFLQGDADAVVADARVVAATSGKSFGWFINESKKLSGILHSVRSSRFELDERTKRNKMSDSKRRCNRLLSICSQLARSLMVEDSWHLSVSWEETEKT